MSLVADATEADDVVQEAAIVGLRRWSSFSPGTSFRAWMGEVIRNVALNSRRKRRREIRRFGFASELAEAKMSAPPTGASPLDATGSLLPSQDAFDDEVLHALMQLEPAARACVLLRSIEGLEYSEISELLDIPKGTAMSHVFRARRVLSGLLSPSSDRGV